MLCVLYSVATEVPDMFSLPHSFDTDDVQSPFKLACVESAEKHAP